MQQTDGGKTIERPEQLFYRDAILPLSRCQLALAVQVGNSGESDLWLPYLLRLARHVHSHEAISTSTDAVGDDRGNARLPNRIAGRQATLTL